MYRSSCIAPLERILSLASGSRKKVLSGRVTKCRSVTSPLERSTFASVYAVSIPRLGSPLSIMPTQLGESVLTAK